MRLKNKKFIIGGGVAAAVAVLAGYFFVVPMVQVNNYKSVIGRSQPQMASSVDKLADTLSKDVFVKTEMESEEIRDDVKAGNKAIKDAEAALATYERDLTSFSPLPLLSFNGQYVAAEQLQANEKEYVAKTRELIAELKPVLSYLDASAEIVDMQLDAQAVVDGIETAETADEFVAKLNEGATLLDKVVNKVNALPVHESLREGHDFQLASAKKTAGLIRDMSAAVKSEDEDKVAKIASELVDSGTEDAKKAQDFTRKYNEESKARKLADRLTQLRRDIDKHIANLW